jgi:hypothetical protein
MSSSRLASQMLHLLTAAHGTSPHFAATQQFSRFLSKADIQRARLQNRIYEYASDGSLPP